MQYWNVRHFVSVQPCICAINEFFQLRRSEKINWKLSSRHEQNTCIFPLHFFCLSALQNSFHQISGLLDWPWPLILNSAFENNSFARCCTRDLNCLHQNGMPNAVMHNNFKRILGRNIYRWKKISTLSFDSIIHVDAMVLQREFFDRRDVASYRRGF